MSEKYFCDMLNFQAKDEPIRKYTCADWRHLGNGYLTPIGITLMILGLIGGSVAFCAVVIRDFPDMRWRLIVCAVFIPIYVVGGSSVIITYWRAILSRPGYVSRDPWRFRPYYVIDESDSSTAVAPGSGEEKGTTAAAAAPAGTEMTKPLGASSSITTGDVKTQAQQLYTARSGGSREEEEAAEAAATAEAHRADVEKAHVANPLERGNTLPQVVGETIAGAPLSTVESQPPVPGPPPPQQQQQQQHADVDANVGDFSEKEAGAVAKPSGKRNKMARRAPPPIISETEFAPSRGRGGVGAGSHDNSDDDDEGRNPYVVSQIDRWGNLRYCKYCKLYKPDFAYHCAVCGHCVYHFDHHCLWLNNCVGRNNYKLFICFIMVAGIVCDVTGIMNIVAIFAVGPQPILKRLPWIVVPIFQLGLGIALTRFWIKHRCWMSKGMSTVDKIIGKRIMQEKERQPPEERSFSQAERQYVDVRTKEQVEAHIHALWGNQTGVLALLPIPHRTDDTAEGCRKMHPDAA